LRGISLRAEREWHEGLENELVNEGRSSLDRAFKIIAARRGHRREYEPNTEHNFENGKAIRPVTEARSRAKGEGEMTLSENSPLVDFSAPASLRKWPSKNNERQAEGRSPYLLIDATLEECLQEFMAKPEPTRHLYEIHTAPQPPLVTPILTSEHVVELARLRDFL
jgi:hypothetical protein